MNEQRRDHRRPASRRADSHTRSGNRRQGQRVNKRGQGFFRSGRQPFRGSRQGFERQSDEGQRTFSEATSVISKGSGKVLRVIPVGGCEEVGRNMYALEYGNDIVIIDMGVQFPEADMYGIDLIAPGVDYFVSKAKNIRGVILTHGHFDHIGAIPYLIHKISNPPMYGLPLTLALVAKRQEDFPDQPKLKLNPISTETKLRLGVFDIEFIRVSHSIPDACMVVISTPEGKVVTTGDYKIDETPDGTDPAELHRVQALGEQNVLLLMSESTHAPDAGHSLSERRVIQTLEEIVNQATGRIIIGLFSTVVVRIQQVLWIAEKVGRKVCLEGFSLKAMVEIATQLGYLKYNKKTIVPTQDGLKLPPEKLIVLCTGAQGQEGAALVRIINKEHRLIKLEKGDLCIFSSSIIPGNERTVQFLKANIARQGVNIVHTQTMDVHSSGHGNAEDMKELLQMVKPKYLLPIHGDFFMRREHGKIFQSLGNTEDRVLLPDNGQVVELFGGKGYVTNERIPADYILIDGLGIGDVSNIVLRDRQQLAADGMIVVICTVVRRTGQLTHNPDIITRGFVYIKENKKLIEDIRSKVKRVMHERDHTIPLAEPYIKEVIREELGQFVFNHTERRPMILPVVIEV